MFFAFDQWLLDKFERFGHQSQLYTGKDCFWWAWVSSILYCIFLLLPSPLFKIDETWKDLILRISPFDVLLGILFFVLANLGAKTRHVDNFVNKLRLEQSKLRLALMLYFLLIDLFAPELARFVRETSFVALMYFTACTPLPPAPSKLKEWLKNKSEALKQILVPHKLPQPVPAPSN